MKIKKNRLSQICWWVMNICIAYLIYAMWAIIANSFGGSKSIEVALGLATSMCYMWIMSDYYSI